MQLIYRKGTFDSGHRVLNERFKCNNVHGHTYHYNLVFECNNVLAIGYSIDFKEIKRLAGDFIDTFFDHVYIANPEDSEGIAMCEKVDSKKWVMSLAKEEYCNPTVENIAKEIFASVHLIFDSDPNINLLRIELDETPNCGTVCDKFSITPEEFRNFQAVRGNLINEFLKEKGTLEYDDRKIK